jgi:hypothetical protein
MLPGVCPSKRAPRPAWCHHQGTETHFCCFAGPVCVAQSFESLRGGRLPQNPIKVAARGGGAKMKIPIPRRDLGSWPLNDALG